MPYPRGKILLLLLSAYLCGGSGGRAAAQEDRLKLTPMPLDGAFLGKKNKAAVDLSGIACMPAVGGRMTCTVVNDENTNVQFVTIDKGRMAVGSTLKIIGDDASPDTLGAPPVLKCGEDDGFGELDGEGVAFSGSYFYVTGSHGCSRSKNKFRLSSFHLARFEVDAAGKQTGSVETTYRVSDVLKRSSEIAGAFGGNLEVAGGLNIEDVAVDGDRIWFGLRGPIDSESRAIIVEASVKDLFLGGKDPSTAGTLPPKKADLKKRGIRDLALLPDKRLLVLAGAVSGPEVPFIVAIFDPAIDKVVWEMQLPAVEDMVDGKKKVGKAEAIAVLDATAREARVVLMFDGLIDGAPHTATIPLK